MAEYTSFTVKFNTVLDNGNAKAKVYITDEETEFEDTIEYKLDIDEIDKFGGKYIDNIAEFLMGKAISQLIGQKKDFRASCFNIYDDE